MWAALAVSGVLLGTISAGWTPSPRVIAAQGLMPVFSLVGCVAAIRAVIKRDAGAVLLGSWVLVGSLWHLGPAMLAESAPRWVAGAPQIRVHSINLNRNNPDVAPAFAAARKSNADVVILLEYVSRFDSELKASGLLDRYPTMVRDSHTDTDVLLTNLPVVRTEVAHAGGRPYPIAAVMAGGREVTVAGVHPQSPYQFSTLSRWTENTSGIATVLQGAESAIAVGDFNSTLWNRPFRELLDAGFVDASEYLGEGLVRTWGPRPVGPLGNLDLLGIDHAISKGALVPLHFATSYVHGSDHRSISATFAVRPVTSSWSARIVRANGSCFLSQAPPGVFG